MNSDNPRLHLHIITGASRGLGLALAQQLLVPCHALLCIARVPNGELARQALAAKVSCEQWSQDLAQTVQAASRLEGWLRRQNGTAFVSASLINNAGMLPTPGPLEDLEMIDIANALRVGVEAPMLLTAVFLRETQTWSCAAAGERRVLNISSALGRRAMAGSAAYCAAKAGMDHWTRAMALEQASHPDGARVVSLAPGLVDTEMQMQLRAGDPLKLPQRDRYAQLQSAGRLAAPATAAARVRAYLRRADYGANPIDEIGEASVPH